MSSSRPRVFQRNQPGDNSRYHAWIATDILAGSVFIPFYLRLISIGRHLPPHAACKCGISNRFKAWQQICFIQVGNQQLFQNAIGFVR